MSLQSNPQQSTTVYTQPTSEEEKKYYSTHSRKRMVYGLIMTVLQAIHAALAIPAWDASFQDMLSKVPSLLPLSVWLAAGALITFHALFRVTWETYWYDKWDKDTRTDSSIWIPAAIMILLLWADKQGAQRFLAKQINPIAERQVEPVNEQHKIDMAEIQQSYDKNKAEISSTYRDKERAATLPYDRQLKSLRNRRAEDKEERRAINAQIASLEAQRDKALAPVLSERGDKLKQALETYTQDKKNQSGWHDQRILDIASHNTAENHRFVSELGNTHTYGWIISAVLLFLISALGYARVRINVRSGILPLRNYTLLDAHGSALERIWTAISDAFNRRSQQFAVWCHQILSPKQAIRSFDGTVVVEPGTYNTPEGFYSQPEPAALPGKQADSPHPTTEMTSDERIIRWAEHFTRLIAVYDKEKAAGRDIQAQEQLVYINSASGPIVPEAKLLGLRYGVMPGFPELMVWRVSNPDHKVPLSQVTEGALTSNIQEEQPEAGEPEHLFKQNLDLFKQTILPSTDSQGRVIGIKYRKENDEWVTYPLTQVQAFHRRYLSRALEKPTEANKEGYAKWNYALSLFGKGERVPLGPADVRPVTL